MSQSERVLWTFPGKIGDTFLEWPVASAWAKQNKTQITVGLSKEMAPIAELFLAQREVEDVILLDGIQHWRCGGQPYDFDFTKEQTASWKKVFHAGLQSFPSYQITQFVRDGLGLKLTSEQLINSGLRVGPRQPRGVLVLHCTPKSNAGEIPRVLSFLRATREELYKLFTEIYCVGLPDDWKTAQDWIDCKIHVNDGWLGLAQFVNNASMVIGAGSSIVALAGSLQVPCIRVHDNASGMNPTIWSSLGPDQYNLDHLRAEVFLEIVQRYALAGKEVVS